MPAAVGLVLGQAICEGSAMPLSRGTVLIVDDHLALRDVLVESLEELGFLCLAASDVEEAKGLLDKIAPEVLLVDHHLPGGTGPELVEWALRQAKAPMEAVLITGDAARAIGGRVRTLLKPVELEQLVRELDAAVARARRP